MHPAKVHSNVLERGRDMDVEFFYRGWEPLLRIVLIGAAGYAGMLVLLRSAGKRTLSQMSAFDFVITLALGASFGRVMTAQDVPLAEVLAAFAVLVGLQYVVSFLIVRVRWLAGVVSRPPRLLYYHGEFIRQAMRAEMVTEAEVRSALRAHGAGSFEAVAAVVLEPNGRFAVVAKSAAGDGTALEPLTQELPR
jgi:uncharacterized membrane protein YcaP (DUF421 family)